MYPKIVHTAQRPKLNCLFAPSVAGEGEPHYFSNSEDRKTGGGSIESLLVPAPVLLPAPLFPACIYLLEAPAFLPACAIVAEPRSFPIYICCKGDSEKLGTFLLPPERNEFVASCSIYVQYSSPSSPSLFLSVCLSRKQVHRCS